jgi:hypothetical protein
MLIAHSLRLTKLIEKRKRRYLNTKASEKRLRVRWSALWQQHTRSFLSEAVDSTGMTPHQKYNHLKVPPINFSLAGSTSKHSKRGRPPRLHGEGGEVNTKSCCKYKWPWNQCTKSKKDEDSYYKYYLNYPIRISYSEEQLSYSDLQSLLSSGNKNIQVQCTQNLTSNKHPNVITSPGMQAGESALIVHYLDHINNSPRRSKAEIFLQNFLLWMKMTSQNVTDQDGNYVCCNSSYKQVNVQNIFM